MAKNTLFSKISSWHSLTKHVKRVGLLIGWLSCPRSHYLKSSAQFESTKMPSGMPFELAYFHSRNWDRNRTQFMQCHTAKTQQCSDTTRCPELLFLHHWAAVPPFLDDPTATCHLLVVLFIRQALKNSHNIKQIKIMKRQIIPLQTAK